MPQGNKLKVKFKWNMRKRKTDIEHERVKIASSRSAIYKKNLKENDPSKYNRQKENDRERWHARKFEESLKKTSIEKREKWALQKKRQRSKSNSTEVKKPKINLKEMSIEEKRAYWRGQRSKSRQSRSRQKVCSDNTKRVTQRREIDNEPTEAPPKEKTVMQNNIVMMEEGMKNMVHSVKLSQNDDKRKVYYKAAAIAKEAGMTYRNAQQLGISKHVYHRASLTPNYIRKKRRDKITETVQKQVVNFWFDCSREYPCKKRVKKNKSIFVLTSSYICIFKEFQRQYPDTKIGFIKFLQLRPVNVRKLNATERNVCCCPKCENAKFLVQALNKACQANDLKELHLKGEKALADLSVCAYTGFPNHACLDTSCNVCTDGMRLHYNALTNLATHQPIKYNRWQTVHEEKMVRDGTKGGKKSKMITSTDLVTHNTTVEDLVEITVAEVNSLSNHIFRARWQQSQFKDAKECMPPNSAVMVIDFAQNYACSYQDEVQSAHWSQNQVTIHTMVAYTNASEYESPATDTVNMIAISPDLKHDVAAVSTYCDLAHTYLKNEYGITKVIQFSDCCASQYRGKNSFVKISQCPGAEHHFFESSHGKSAADGLSAVVKHAVTSAVTNNKALVRNAGEFFAYCEEYLTTVCPNAAFPSQRVDSKRKFFYIDEKEINRTKMEGVKTVKGTMSIHAVRATGQSHHIQSRPLSCFCMFCTKGEGTVCINERYAGIWKSQKLQLTKGMVIHLKIYCTKYEVAWPVSVF